MEAHAHLKSRFLLVICCLSVPLAVLGGRNGTAPSRPRVVNIGALFTINSVIGRSARPAIKAAVDDVNSDSSILSGTKLNLIVQDTNCSGFIGTVDGNRLIPLSCFLAYHDLGMSLTIAIDFSIRIY